jgi:hypothetical protein
MHIWKQVRVHNHIPINKHKHIYTYKQIYLHSYIYIYTFLCIHTVHTNLPTSMYISMSRTYMIHAQSHRLAPPAMVEMHLPVQLRLAAQGKASKVSGSSLPCSHCYNVGPHGAPFLMVSVGLELPKTVGICWMYGGYIQKRPHFVERRGSREIFVLTTSPVKAVYKMETTIWCRRCQCMSWHVSPPIQALAYSWHTPGYALNEWVSPCFQLYLVSTHTQISYFWPSHDIQVCPYSCWLNPRKESMFAG